jgi:Tol biopolymer transport system component
MKKALLYLLTIITLSLVALTETDGQFYNGMQMAFGKNRVQHYNFFWSYYRFDNFDCYFNEDGRDLAQYTASYASKRLEELEDYFDYQLEKRMIFIIYNKHTEFRQNNVGLISGEEDYNTGGYSRIIKNKVMLYYEGDRESLNHQISSSIAEVLINEMLNNADVKDRTSSSTQIYFPDWYIKGLVAYVAGTWNFESENRVREGFSDERYRNLNHLEYDDALYAGHSFWRFIADTYGDPIIPNIIYLTKIYKNINDGFMYVLGQKLREISDDWKKYLDEYFSEEPGGEPGAPDLLRKAGKEQVIQSVRMSHDRRYIAYVTNDWGRRRIWLHDEETGKRTRVFAVEPKLEQIIDYTYPVIAWHPNGRILTFINEEKGGLKIYFYRTDEKSLQSLNLLYFEKVLSFSYSPDGTRLVMSAVRNGMTDIYVHTIASATSDQITNDLADDLDPTFLRGRNDHIMFSSNRLTDTLKNTGDPLDKTGLVFNLFTFDLTARSNLLQRVSDEKLNDRFKAIETGNREITFIGNDNGVLNRYRGTFDSTISYIDTITHYRYFLRSAPLTNYSQSILDYDYNTSSATSSEVTLFDNRYRLARAKGGVPPINSEEMDVTRYRAERTSFLHKADSIEQLRQWLLEEDRRRRDTLTKPLYEYYITDEPININHYIFEREKQNYYEQLWRKDYMDIDLDTGRMQFPEIRVYLTAFYNNYVASQVDFSFLNNSYQAFNGGAPYFNPGLNLLTKIGTVDLFENYKITGGFRFSGNFDSNEYLLSLENLKGKYDKQFVFHRQAFNSSNDTNLYKIHSHNNYLSFSKPLTEAFALKGTLIYRYDRYVILSTDIPSLSAPNIQRHWAGLKAEAIYDNTRKRAVNIYYGTRFKIFGEYYREVTTKKSDLFVVGADFRHYLKIHRELIWANRFAASSSFGPTKLIYYLGGVDNWMGYLFNSLPMFDNTIPVDPTKFYGFQALATNMRGFTQNIRNGNNFALINSELRWPFIRYFAGHPLRSAFLNSLQLVGFGDIGTAWSGVTPWSGENAYDTETIKSGPITVVIDSNREPIVAGFGGGLRAQLFGYFIRADLAWGIENRYIMPKIFYLSFSLDF